MPIVHLDIDPWELGKNYATSVAILGDARATLPELNAAIRRMMSAGQRRSAQARPEAARAATLEERAALRRKADAEAGASPVRPLALLQAIGDLLPKDAVVVEEALSSGTGMRQFIRSDDPQSFFGLRGGGIGWGLPAAIGVKLALPARPVVALIGDGSAMYTVQALWTAAHRKIAVVFVILNNASYRILKQRTQALRGHAAQTARYVGMELTDPAIDFVGLARSLGLAAGRARNVGEACDLIRAGLASDAPSLVEVDIERSL
jgi:benzoylformate decarboxylase